MTRKPAAFTLIELLVVIGIIAILASLIIAAIPKLTQSGNKAASLNNLRQLGSAFYLYAGDNNNQLPGRVKDAAQSKWPRLLISYLGNDPKVYAEPGDPNNYLHTKKDPLNNGRNQTSYIMNGYNDLGAYDDPNVTVRINSVSHPSRTILMATQSGTGNYYMDFVEGNQNGVLNKTVYGTGSNYLFADGSARFLSEKDYDEMGGDDLWLVDKTSDIAH